MLRSSGSSRVGDGLGQDPQAGHRVHDHQKHHRYWLSSARCAEPLT